MINQHEHWQEPNIEEKSSKKNPLELQKNSEIKNSVEVEPKSSRRKNNAETGSRWLAPILLVITVILSLLFQLFKQKP